MRRRFLVWLHCRHSDSPWQLQVLALMDVVALMDLVVLMDLMVLKDLVVLMLLHIFFHQLQKNIFTIF